MTDWGALYRDNAAAVAALARGLSEEQLASVVPASPAWTAHEVLAHLAGGPADAVTGRMAGAPGPEWTARHVAERRLLPVEDLVEELLSHQDAVAASTVDNPRPAIVWDLAVHHADLHEAFGLGVPPERFWRPVVDLVATMAVPDGVAVDGVSPYELFRALFSRRSQAQLRPLGLEGLGIFGPREDDQPVP